MNAWELLKQSPLAPGEPEILLGFLFGKDREYVLTHSEIGLSPETIIKFKQLEKKRLAGWSIAVLVGEKEFYGLNFIVDKNVLVPRPETEMIVDEIRKLQVESPLFIDLGTGPGTIIITAAKYSKLNNADYIGIDISGRALSVAAQNAQAHNLSKEIKFIRGNLLKPVLKLLPDRNLIIAANLPYLTKKQIINSPSILKEPRLALDGGLNGLKYYRELFIQLQDIKYKSLHLFIEIDPSQKQKITALTKKYFPRGSFEIIKDLAGLDRLLIIKQ